MYVCIVKVVFDLIYLSKIQMTENLTIIYRFLLPFKLQQQNTSMKMYILISVLSIFSYYY